MGIDFESTTNNLLEVDTSPEAQLSARDIGISGVPAIPTDTPI